MSDCPSERASSVWEFSDVSSSLETAAGDLLAVPTKNWAFSGTEAWDSPSSSIRAQTVGAGRGLSSECPWDSVCVSLVNGLENAVCFWQAWITFSLRNPWKEQFSLVTPCFSRSTIL